jgi:hypothetical protein
MNADDPPGGVSTTRRRFLAASGTALFAAVAGCTAVADFIGDQILEEVNVLNQMDQDIKGSVTVIDPAGDTALDETFDVPSKEDPGDGNVATYSDVWGDTGDYEINVELTNAEVEGTSQASKTVTIDDTDEDRVGIAPGPNETDEPIPIRVGESLSDFGQTESG